MAQEAKTPEAAAPEKPARIKQNGVTRPAEGTKTGHVWDVADSMSAELGRPVLAAELVEKLGPDFNKSTVATQYNLWCNFHGVSAEQRKAVRDEGREAIKAEKAAAKAAEKAEKAAAKEAEKAAKAAEKATAE